MIVYIVDQIEVFLEAINFLGFEMDKWILVLYLVSCRLDLAPVRSARIRFPEDLVAQRQSAIQPRDWALFRHDHQQRVVRLHQCRRRAHLHRCQPIQKVRLTSVYFVIRNNVLHPHIPTNCKLFIHPRMTTSRGSSTTTPSR